MTIDLDSLSDEELEAALAKRTKGRASAAKIPHPANPYLPKARLLMADHLGQAHPSPKRVRVISGEHAGLVGETDAASRSGFAEVHFGRATPAKRWRETEEGLKLVDQPHVNGCTPIITGKMGDVSGGSRITYQIHFDDLEVLP